MITAFGCLAVLLSLTGEPTPVRTTAVGGQSAEMAARAPDGPGLVPERLYCGVGRAIPVLVRAPAAPAAKGQVEVVLCSWQGAELARAPVMPGQVDLAPLLPQLWSEQRRDVRLVQLVVEGVARGSPVVLQPLVTPRRAVPDARTTPPGVTFIKPDPADDVYSGLRVYASRHVVLHTSEGPIELRLRPDAAPNTAFVFRELVAGGFYTDIPFHRVVALGRDGHPFVIQAGDPTPSGSGSFGQNIDLEPSTLAHDLGVVSMARDSDPNTNGSQFFIALSRAGTARLDGLYTAFGEVVDGLSVVQAIARTPVRPGTDKPVQPPVIARAELIDAPPLTPVKSKPPESPGAPAGTSPGAGTGATPGVVR